MLSVRLLAVSFALWALFYSTADARKTLVNVTDMSELPSSIQCPGSQLYSAEIVDPRHACSAAYYNCLGVHAGGLGLLTYCQDGLVFDKDHWTEDFQVGHRGACSLSAAACSTTTFIGIPVPNDT